MSQEAPIRDLVRARARATARHVALDGLFAAGKLSGNIERALARPRVALPYLHAIPRSREPRFRSLLTALAKTHTFIDYDEAMARIKAGNIDKPYVSFSFDDGFQSNVRAARILEEFGTTGCFFVPTKFIGTPSVTEARRFFGYSHGVDEPAMTWSDLEVLRARGHLVENHTLNHNVLAWISETQYGDEIGSAAEQLRSRLGRARHFAWPRGRFFHFNRRAAQVVFETGHETCASAERGAHVEVHAGPKEDLCIRRDHIMMEWPLRHIEVFLARSALKAGRSSNTFPEAWS